MKRNYIYYILINLLYIAISKVEDSTTKKASLYYNKIEGTFKLIEGILDKNAIAYGSYTPSYEEKGWDFLTLSSYDGSDDKFPDELKNYAMGYLEGKLTYKRIKDAYYSMSNFKYYKTNGIMPESTRQFFEENLQYVRDMSLNKRDFDSYWHEVYNLYMQMKGLYEGFISMLKEEEKMDLIHFQTLISLGDLDELNYWKKENRPDYSKMSIKELIEFVDTRSHCSSLIKIADDLSDVWFGHNTWTAFNKMIRIYKEYKYIPNPKFPIKSNVITMSSYPGAINSQDDFYITSANLYITETTNNVFNTDLFDNLMPHTLMCWMRTMLANRLTDNGKLWTNVFARENSGTYNNQFQILDLKLIDTTQKIINDGALWIVEQLPGSCDNEDVTTYLRRGYWPSYNTPFIMSVREKSGVLNQTKEKPETKINYDYSTCARAKIFRRDHSKIKNLNDFENMLRYNDYKNDIFSEGKPNLSIAARYDFQEKPMCYGATDAKIASINEIKTNGVKKVHIIGGPTTNNQEPFDWSTTKCTLTDPIRWKVEGHVDKYDFKWIDYELSLW